MPLEKMQVVLRTAEDHWPRFKCCLLTSWLSMGKALTWLCFSFSSVILADKGYTVHRVVKVQGGNCHRAFKSVP